MSKTAHGRQVMDEALKPMRIVLIDDNLLFRTGLRRLIEGLSAHWCVSDVAAGAEALDFLRERAFDLAIIDPSLPEVNRLTLVRRVRQEFPQLRLLMLSLCPEEQHALRAIKAGVHGYLGVDCTPQDLASVIRKVGGGGEHLSPELAERMVRCLTGEWDAPRHARLSDRELDILCRMVSGQRIGEIADALHISVKTVSTHKSRILDRMRLPNLAALIRYGLEHGLVPGGGPSIPAHPVRCAG